MQVPISELKTRMSRFRMLMDIENQDWKMAAIFSKINLYYFTGTMQEGMLLILRDSESVYWVRRSYERALDESLFDMIKPMNSFQDAAKSIKHLPDTIYIETEIVPIAMFQRFQKHFPFTNVKSLDAQIAKIRSVKSKYELTFMEQSGKIHERVLEELVPKILKEGVSEVEFAIELFAILIEEGHHGLVRFGMFDTEMVLGHIGFGESSIYPTSFNGPGGNYGMSAAVPFLGNRNRKLKIGDLVFVDVGCGVEGYHTDKTMTYMFGKAIPDEAIEIHKKCVSIQHNIALLLKPGSIPSKIYNSILGNLPEKFLEDFMGYGNRQVKFLGHGIGLTIDEYPVIAQGFDEPLEEGMILALEPKKGIKGVGMVGIENTFLVTPTGGRCITGNHPGLILID